MKITARIAFCTMLLLVAAAPLLAQSGPSANGNFEFFTGGNPLAFQFDARIQNNGSTRGQITFSGVAEILDQDVDGEGLGSGGSLVNVSLQVDVDCLTVNGNRAAMSGVVNDSSIPALIGSHVLLAVQDNGEGVKALAPDGFMWGLYGTPDLTWVASDAELPFDSGIGLTWFATDFEREDDQGIPSNPSGIVDCHTFSFAAYELQELAHGGGSIQVRP